MAGNQLKALREKNRMTQKQLADVSGVPRICITRYENGAYKPNMKNAAKIAVALGTTIDELMRDRDDYDEKRHSGLLEE